MAPEALVVLDALVSLSGTLHHLDLDRVVGPHANLGHVEVAVVVDVKGKPLVGFGLVIGVPKDLDTGTHVPLVDHAGQLLVDGLLRPRHRRAIMHCHLGQKLVHMHLVRIAVEWTSWVVEFVERLTVGRHDAGEDILSFHVAPHRAEGIRVVAVTERCGA